MASSGVIRRKRRSGNSCSNPLFVKWLEEWRDEAQKAGKKTVYTYSKALNSVKKYPLLLSSGKEAKILENVGDKIARMLDKKISDHLASGGSLQDLHGGKRYRPTMDSSCPGSCLGSQSVSCNAVNSHSSPVLSPQPLPNDSLPVANPCSQASSEVAAINSPPQAKQRKKRARTEYVPAYRSGPYAILIALFRAEENPGYRGFMFKQEVQDAAQPYCDASFTMSDAGNYYTAWSSMSTVIRKGFVNKYSHPPRYLLTKDGSAMALKLLQAQANTCSSPPISSQQRTSFHSTGHDTLNATNPHEEGTSNKPETDSFRFWYVDSAGKCVREKDRALVDISDKLSVGFLVKCDRRLLKRCKVRHIIDEERGVDGSSVFAFIHNDSAPDQCSPPTADSSSPNGPTQCANDLTASDSEDDDLPPQLSLRVQALRSKSLQTVAKHVPTPPHSFNVEELSKCSSNAQCVDRISEGIDSTSECVGETRWCQDSSQSSSSTLVCESQPREDMESQQQLENEIIVENLDLSDPEHVLCPGEFDIVLCVDNSESTASRKSTSHFRGLLLEELAKNGVKFSVRKLSVGDFLWVAQQKVAHVPGHLRLPSSTEIVLEYIIERKRMDDLAGSIIDRRFQEQKYRMKHCGITHPTYLVEEHADLSYCSLAPSALQQAITNTQVQDGFYVKQTSNIRESVAYLTLMTRYIQSLYSSKIVKAYSMETILLLNQQKKCSKVSFDKNVIHSMTFGSFNQASVKTKVFTVSEMFARHLIVVPRSSADKAHAIVQLYPTVSHLRDAYRRCTSDKERDNLLKNIRAGPTKRRIGPVLSSTICSLYWREKSPANT